MASSTALSVAFMRASSRWQRRRVFQTDSRDLGAPVVPLVAILCQLAWPEYNPLRRSRQRLGPLAPGAYPGTSTIPTVLPSGAHCGGRAEYDWAPILGDAGDLHGCEQAFTRALRASRQGSKGPGPRTGDPWRHQGVVPMAAEPEPRGGSVPGLHPALAGGGQLGLCQPLARARHRRRVFDPPGPALEIGASLDRQRVVEYVPLDVADGLECHLLAAN